MDGMCVWEGEEEERNAQFPREAASWYRWFPMTVVVSLRSLEISLSGLSSRHSVRRSVLLRRHASMRISLTEAP